MPFHSHVRALMLFEMRQMLLERLNRCSLSRWKHVFNVRHHWGDLLVLFIPVVASVVVATPLKDYWYVWVAQALLFIAGWIQSTVHSLHVKELREEIDKVDAEREILESTLQDLPQRMLETAFQGTLGLDLNERISLYRFTGTQFIGLARYAKYHKFNQWHRTEYSSDEGFIGEAWRRGLYECDSLPDPNVDFDGYVDEIQSQVSIPRKTLENMTMKSRAYSCKTLEHRGKPIAVVVIESTNPSLPVKQRRLKNWLGSDFVLHLAEIVYTNLPAGKPKR